MTLSHRRLCFASFFLIGGLVSIACNESDDPPTTGTPDGSSDVVEVDDANTIPCAPRAVLQSVCQRCHQNPPIRGAPFPLVTRSNIVRVGVDGEIRQLMIQQLDARRMPLAPETIDEDARTILLDWLKAGAPATSPQTCSNLEDASGEDASEDAATEDVQLIKDASTEDALTPPEDASDDAPDE